MNYTHEGQFILEGRIENYLEVVCQHCKLQAEIIVDREFITRQFTHRNLVVFRAQIGLH